MAEILVRPPRRADIPVLVANLREADRQELEAARGGEPHEAVRSALALSSHRWAMDVDGNLGLVGGIVTVSLLNGIGSPWLLGTTELDRIPGALTKIGLRYRDVALGLFPELVNYVDARNVKAIRWLKRLGFTVSDTPVPYGVSRLPFYRFELRS